MIRYILVLFLMLACNREASIDAEHSIDESTLTSSDEIDRNTATYFQRGALDDDYFVDSVRNKHFSAQLQLLEEPRLIYQRDSVEMLRLTVSTEVMYNLYTIRITKRNNLYEISFKMAGDSTIDGRDRTGLSHLTLDYQTKLDFMDSVYISLESELTDMDFFSLNNSKPESPSYTNVDGTSFILEYYSRGRYNVLYRHWGELERGLRDKSSEFLSIVSILHSLVPSGFIADIETAKSLEDLRFPVFKKR